MNIIFWIHVIFLLGILIVPFTNDKKNLEFYSILIPFLFYHWSVNDDTCALTQAECYVTGQPKESTFMHRVVSPIYKMEDNQINNITKSIFFFLWFFVQYRLGHFNRFVEELGNVYKVKKNK